MRVNEKSEVKGKAVLVYSFKNVLHPCQKT